jgi:hypothetical protein
MKVADYIRRGGFSMDELLSLRDCARRLGVASHRIAYAHENGLLPDVGVRVAGKRIYTTADLKRVAEYFGIKLDEANKARGTDGQ